MKPQKLYYILTNTSDRNKFIQILKNSRIKPINHGNRKWGLLFILVYIRTLIFTI